MKKIEEVIDLCAGLLLSLQRKGEGIDVLAASESGMVVALHYAYEIPADKTTVQDALHARIEELDPSTGTGKPN